MGNQLHLADAGRKNKLYKEIEKEIQDEEDDEDKDDDDNNKEVERDNKFSQDVKVLVVSMV